VSIRLWFGGMVSRISDQGGRLYDMADIATRFPMNAGL